MLLDLIKTTLNPPKLTTSVFNERFIDIHSHILPGIDDGAESIEDAVLMLRKLKTLGITNFVFTPHVMNEVWENSSDQILGKFHEFQFHVHEHPDLQDVSMRVAAEYMLDENFLKLLSNHDLLTVKENKILVELSYLNPSIQLFELVAEIIQKGYVPILAHPERYINFHQNQGMYCKLKSAGCLFQVNLLSLSNYYNKEVQDAALWLIRNNLIDFIGTDAHRVHQVQAIENMLQKFGLVQLIKPLVKNNNVLL